MTNIKAQNKNYQNTYKLSTSTVVNKWVEENTKPLLTRCRKIKIKPNKESQKYFKEFFYTSNYVYNKTVNHINKHKKNVNFQNLRDEFVTANTKKYNNNYKIIMNNLKELNKQLKNDLDNKLIKIQILNAKNELKEIKFEKNNGINEWELKHRKKLEQAL
jgi:hypothetical protein